jgi:hypothetical protein
MNVRAAAGRDRGSASATKSNNSSFVASMIHVDGFQSANFRGSGACHLLVLRACARRTKQPKPVKVSFLIDQVYGRFWPGCCRWRRNYRYRPLGDIPERQVYGIEFLKSLKNPQARH